MRLLSRMRRTTPGILGAAALAATLVASSAGTPAGAAENAQPTAAVQRAWQTDLARVPQPSKGCFTATYPALKWRETQCVSPPSIPMTPNPGPRPLVVGNGNDISAKAPGGGIISNAIGSFDSVSGVTSVSSPIGNVGPPVANAYTLQVNTEHFVSTACAGSPNPNCKGWEQFVFENNGTTASAFIQYWLLQYNTTCPASWTSFMFTGFPDIYCYKNSPGSVPVPQQPITNLQNLSLSGTVSSVSDSVTMYVGTTAYTTTGSNAVNAAAGWTIAEFNIFGYGGNSSGGSMATFNSGASLNVRTRINYGGVQKPDCVAQGFTGETNNLGFGSPAPPVSGLGPAILFIENTAGPNLASCMYATAVGDTHQHTFDGLHYDFQASGDFVEAQAGSAFEVQTRKVSGAPTWPNASVNQAVGTRMGGTTVAVCGGPRLVVDGRSTELTSGKSLSLPSGVVIHRIGNRYFVADQAGNSIRATVNSTHIDLSVGLGTWPQIVRGLLGNPDNDVKRLEARDGTQFSVPVSFENLYQHFGNSWRVAPSDSLLGPCGDRVQLGNPTKPFFVNDLAPETRERARAICIQAKATQALLDACTLDVAVLGERAAAVHVGARTPVLIG